MILSIETERQFPKAGRIVSKPNLDQASAIMIAIEHCGDIQPGQKCAAIYFGVEDIERERAFYERFCRGNGATDEQEIEAMVSSHVLGAPYWLVSFKPNENQDAETLKDSNPQKKAIRFHRVDDRTGQVVPDPE